MFEVIVGLALLPVAIVVGFSLLGIGIAAIFYLGGWLLAAFGILLMANGAPGPAGVICFGLGAMWGYGSVQWAKGAMQ